MFGKKKEVSKAQLKNVEVEYVSLLFDDVKPANGKDFVVKHDGKSYCVKGSSVRHRNDLEGRIFVTVYEPGTQDSHGDSMTAEEVVKACEYFSQGGMVRKNDVNHNMQPVDEFVIVENYILRTADKEHFPNTKIGSWVQVLKCKDLSCGLWKKVIAGNFNGVSLYGKAEDGGEGKDDKAELISMLNKLIAEFEAKGDEKYQPAIDELKQKIAELDTTAKSEVFEKQINVIEKSLNSLMSSLTKAFNTKIEVEDAPAEPVSKEVRIGDRKVVIKSEKKELYKAFSDIDSGTKQNILSDNLGQQFLDTVMSYDPDDLFSDITCAELDKSEKIDRGLIEGIVLRNTKDAKIAHEAVKEFDIEVKTDILTGGLILQEDTVEFYRDKKGEEAFGAYVEEKVVEKVQEQISELMFEGDRDSSEANIKGMDGFIKHMSDGEDHELIDKSEFISYADMLTGALKKFSNRVLGKKRSFVIYCSPGTLLSIQQEYANRQTELGDKFTVSDDKVYFNGIRVKDRPMPNDTFIVGIAKFMILGYRKDVKIKVEHDGDNWVWKWNVRVRFGTTVVSGGFVKLFETSGEFMALNPSGMR